MAVRFEAGVPATDSKPATPTVLRVPSSRRPDLKECGLFVGEPHLKPESWNEPNWLRLRMCGMLNGDASYKLVSCSLHVAREDILALADAIRRGEI